jgi:single-stranded-DNA-specific exonuclease
MDSLERLGPFGQGNPYPLFMDTDIHVCTCKTVGQRHRQMVLQCTTGSGDPFPAIQFNAADDSSKVTNRLEKIAYRPQWNYWNGRKRLQLLIEDIKPKF